MASLTEFDLASIDRTQIAVDRATLDEYLAQRGTFAVLDHLVHVDEEGGVAVGVKEIRADDWWAPDHIPGRPMFPGALMIETAAQIASFDYSRFRVEPGDDRFVGFGGVESCRFRGVVEPPCNLFFVVKLLRAGSRMFKYQAEAYIERDGVLQPKRCFEAEVLGVLL
jgi:3-hydroxyacyl-[acyl-carrier-protein] dehydratase